MRLKKKDRKKLKISSEWETVIKTKKAVENFVDPLSSTFGSKKYSAIAAGLSPQGLSTPNTTEAISKTMTEAFGSAGITRDLLAKRHKALLMKNETRWNPMINAFEETDKPDTVAVKASLEMAYKIQGDFAAEKIAVGIADITSILQEIQNDERSTPTINPAGRFVISGRSEEAPGRSALETEQSILYRGQERESGEVSDEQVSGKFV